MKTSWLISRYSRSLRSHASARLAAQCRDCRVWFCFGVCYHKYYANCRECQETRSRLHIQIPMNKNRYTSCVLISINNCAWKTIYKGIGTLINLIIMFMRKKATNFGRNNNHTKYIKITINVGNNFRSLLYERWRIFKFHHTFNTDWAWDITLRGWDFTRYRVRRRFYKVFYTPCSAL